MARHVSKLKLLYKKLIIDYRLITLTMIFSFLYFSILQIPKFRLDASADSLVLEGNQKLAYYEKIKEKYSSDNFLIITYSAKDQSKIINYANLKHLGNLHHEIEDLANIASIISVINAPLLASPKLSLKQAEKGPIVTLDNDNFSSYKQAETELSTSPIYSDILLSKDGYTAALLIKLAYNNLQDPQAEEQIIQNIRQITSKYKDQAEIYMGGVPMITVDSINYIKNDIVIFGTSAIILISLFLWFSLKQIKWLVIALSNAALILTYTIAILTYLDWPVTVVSANFISLLLIISISLSIHYIVHYEELINKENLLTHYEIILKTAAEKVRPCLYTALTTIVAFSSLIISDIKPVISFGWMMTIGIIIAFFVSFTFIPTILTFCKRQKKQEYTSKLYDKIAEKLCQIIEKQKLILVFSFLLLSSLSIFGLSKLTVDNRFIDYYKKDTEIYKGMEIIDQKLGGTTPVEIIINAPEEFLTDEFSLQKNYWYNSFIISDISKIESYLESLPEIGKTLSIASSIESLKVLNDGNIDSFFLAIVKKKISEDIKNILFSPYLSEDGNQIRIIARVYESSGNLKRQELIDKIRADLSNNFAIAAKDLHITGMLVLYNDMLQSLFKSQILTLAAVFIAIAIMFAGLFRNIKIALIAIIPNIISGIVVLGVMGLFNIPLDIMTITIAAITVGISVDDTIHYLDRYLEEYKIKQNGWQAIITAHKTIGRALYLTTFAIGIGFITLIASNFVPTIYFGLLTCLAMLIALLADLLLLPILLLFFSKNNK